MSSDIQPGNIMLHNPDEDALQSYLEERYRDEPAVSDAHEEYTIVRSRNLRHHYIAAGVPVDLMTFDFFLGDWGVACWQEEHLSEVIQPQLLRAPEVILEAPWGTSVDLWNLGAVLPELMFGQNMFSGMDSGAYTIRGHLAEMNALLGPFPQPLLADAKLAKAKDMFDKEGNIRKYRLERIVSLEQRFSSLPEDEARKFEAFVRRLLELDPGQRPTAQAMLEQPWLSHEYTEGMQVDNVG